MSGTWASGWVAGDIVTAAEFAKGAGAIYDTTLGGTAASIDITGIIDDYAHLLLILSGRSDTAAASAAVTMRLNNDSGNNYDYQFYTTRTTPANSVASAQAQGAAGYVTAANGTSGAVGISQILIPNYAAATLRKAWIQHTWVKSATDGTTASYETIVGGGEWRSTAAITRVTLATTGNFIAGTRATLYGLGA